MRAVAMVSGGRGSWASARRAVERWGADEVVALFADTLVEDESTYTFLREGVAHLGCELVEVSDGRTPFEVFKDDRFLGNSRLANCSKYLKQKPCREWVEENAPEDATIVVGIDFSEAHRIGPIEKGWAPRAVWAPLCERPYLSTDEIMASIKDAGLTPPSAYADGLPHANCLEQGCVRGGQAYWHALLRTRPHSYAYAEREEQKLREHLDADVGILKDRSGGEATPLTLRDFRGRLEDRPSLFDEFEWGGCGCFVEGE